MAVQVINIGNLVNDGLGDDLRTAFDKVNQNFAALDNQLSVEGVNVGASGTGIYKQKTNYQLEFKKIAGSSNVSITESGDVITVDSPLQNTFRYINANGNGQTIGANSGSDTVFFQGSDNITVTASGNTITFQAETMDGQLSKDLDLNSYNIIGTGNINITGTITATNYSGLLEGYTISGLANGVYDVDFGGIGNTYPTGLSFLVATSDQDFGYFTNPSAQESDFGTI
jgi:hypothetical protein